MRQFVTLLLFMAAAVAVTVTAETTVAQSVSSKGTSPGADKMPSLEQLLEMCQAAKQQFRPLTAEDLAQAKAELATAVKVLGRKLNVYGATGTTWKRYLNWDAFTAQVRPNVEPDPKILHTVLRRLEAGHDGLDLIWFVDTRNALRQYRAVAGAIGNDDLKANYDQLLDMLAEQLKAFNANPNPDNAQRIGDALGQLHLLEQAPELIAAVHRRYSHPNAFLQVSSNVIEAAVEQPVDEETPVYDTILGTRITGQGHTFGSTVADLVPDPNQGVLDILFNGTTRSNNVGRNGPATVRSIATTQVAARKRLWMDYTGLHAFPTGSRAVVSTQITSIYAGGGIAQRVARNQVAQQKSQAEQISAQHAEQRTDRRMDEEVGKMVAQANQQYEEKVRRPLVNRGLFPQQFMFTTTQDAISLLALRAAPDQLAAATRAPTVPKGTDLSTRIHESMINNMTQSALAGMTLKDKRMETIVLSFVDELPEELKPQEGQLPWAINFDRRQPVTVTFADDGYEMIIRGRRFYEGTETYPAMNIKAAYKFVRNGQGIKAVRQGDVEVLPPGFKPDSNDKLSANEVAIRRLLTKRFSQVFKEEVPVESIEPNDQWTRLGTFQPTGVVCKDGWLMTTYKRVPRGKTATPQAARTAAR